MSDEESIFAEALTQASPAQRAAFLAQACGADTELRSQVEALLHAYERGGAGGGILEAPPPHLDVTLAAIEDHAADAVLGSVIGPYKLLQQIGEGVMGAVYMAEQLRPVRRMVAIKIIKPGLDTKQVIARFEAERQALALMDHPNIAKVF